MLLFKRNIGKNICKSYILSEFASRIYKALSKLNKKIQVKVSQVFEQFMKEHLEMTNKLLKAYSISLVTSKI